VKHVVKLKVRRQEKDEERALGRLFARMQYPYEALHSERWRSISDECLHH